ncbi:short-subunit dehydrogenase [Isoptericola sp. CG 20/1183]|uniref:Short-subunit dehydrogenase n=1 Tax=Isoptericola halotolerans TaxID=300560 RepID=A0ABX5EI37_9MICO|nr:MULTISPECIES: SDR family oxidoreductase [Isoptericola]MCK0116054.1 SDR family oxidoreductase [Isoptericola sp. S6320L]PRZ08768.1 short-subunit dehydrogenase [Isoptericola halotolerans]PRZ10785.1 short-subunit dehydrogenase [Isoptericola sp. CG 20/1183]
MNVTDQIALVTGANRGIGRQFVLELLERGASKVYAAARRPESLDFDDARVVPLRMDLLDHGSVVAAAATARDVTLLVNNAGISTGAALVTGDLAEVRREMDTHFWGTLDVTREFAPVLSANGGGAIVNILSALSWFVAPGTGSYSAAKAAEWNMTNGVRTELAAQGTLVQGVLLGAADTDIAAGYDGPKIDAREVPRRSLDGLAVGSIEVIVDDWTAMVKASLAGDPAAFYAQMNELLGAS